jgi:hypothetical protein
MPGLAPGIHILTPAQEEDVDGRDKSGHDGKRPIYFTNEQPPSATGRNACSAAMVDTSL